MKKLLYTLLAVSLIFSACKKEEEEIAITLDLENTIVGKEWSLSNANEDGFLLAEDGKFYLTEKCQSNTPIGNWIIDGDLIKYQFTDNTQEITILWGEVSEYSESQIKLLDYSDSLITITEVYILGTADIYGCMDVTAANYNPAAECIDSCIAGVAIGDAYEGGIVFYVDGIGGGLIAAPTNLIVTPEWGCQATLIGGTSYVIGTGAQNTINIEAGCTTPNTAADVCANLTIAGYSDWFLPSKDELNEMYLNIGQGNALGLGNIGGFTNNYYWSSTESGSNYAWVQKFTNGYQVTNVKYGNFNVRAVRAF
jgi:hypothetical protein